MSDALAVALQQRGVEPGERVAMYLQNIPQVLVAVLAAWKCGAVIVPCNPMLRERELVKILTDSGSRVLICQDDLYARGGAGGAAVARRCSTPSPRRRSISSIPARPRRAVLAGGRRGCGTRTCSICCDLVERHAGQVPEPVEITGDDVAFMVYTSGTTGEPKAAMNTHRNVVFATSVYERWIGLTPTDTILGLAPLFHVTGLIGHVTLAMLTGSPLVLFYRFDRRGSVPARRPASRHVHGVRRHRVHRAPQQRGDGRPRPLVADQGLHRRRADAAGRARRLAAADGHAHPADVRADGSHLAHAHDAARRGAAGGRANRRDVGRRAGVQHRRAHRDRRAASTPSPARSASS